MTDKSKLVTLVNLVKGMTSTVYAASCVSAMADHTATHIVDNCHTEVKVVSKKWRLPSLPFPSPPFPFPLRSP